MATPIAIFGTGSSAREALQIIHDINLVSPTYPIWRPVCFIVDAGYQTLECINGIPVIQGSEILRDQLDIEVVVGIGSPATRRRVAVEITENYGNRFAKLVHPTAWIGRMTTINPGAIVCAGCMINTDTHIGALAHVNLGCTFSHDTVLSDFVTLARSVCVTGNVTNVTIEKGCEIGAGSVIIPHVRIGEWSTIGAGATVTQNLPSNITAVGNPARVVKTRPLGWQNAQLPAT
jgi:sugar O-acyltransferase (sialic acid O-acetyltransferase NeuD family)